MLINRPTQRIDVAVEAVSTLTSGMESNVTVAPKSSIIELTPEQQLYTYEKIIVSGFEKYVNIYNYRSVIINSPHITKVGFEADEFDIPDIVPPEEDANVDGEEDPFADTKIKEEDMSSFSEEDDDFANFGNSDKDSDSDIMTKNKEVEIPVDKAIDDKFDLSKIIRHNFPKQIATLHEVVINNVNILERNTLVNPKLENMRISIISRYKKLILFIVEYLDSIDTERYEDIFKNYLSMWHVANELKTLTVKIYS